MQKRSSHALPAQAATILLVLLTLANYSRCQVIPANAPSSSSVAHLDDSNLPNAPSATSRRDITSSSPQINSTNHTPGVLLKVAPKYATVIEPEYHAQNLSAGDKTIYSAQEIFSYYYPIGAIVSAGLSQATKTDPHYGGSKEAFAQRVGAAGARQASQVLFSDGLLAPILREDPRYYVLGPGHSIVKRFSYAATRVLITRTDHGKGTVNLSTLGGYGGAAALTQLYYPVRSRDTETILSNYGLSLGGKALGYEIAEFARFLIKGQPRE